MSWLLSSFLFLAGVIYVGGGFLERSLAFFPSRRLEATPADVGLAFEEVWLRTADGVAINAWWLPHDDARATVVFSNGNAGNISHRLEKLAILQGLGLNTLIYDYRGYGRSHGRPREAGMYADAHAAYDFVVTERHVPPGQIVAYGESLGGPVSVELARRRELGGVILEGAFTSIPEIARVHYPLLAPLARMRFDALGGLPEVRAPVLILHSRNDEIVPFAQAERLLAAANEPKRLVALQGGHNGAFLTSGDTYTEAIRAFLDDRPV